MGSSFSGIYKIGSQVPVFLHPLQAFFNSENRESHVAQFSTSTPAEKPAILLPSPRSTLGKPKRNYLSVNAF